MKNKRGFTLLELLIAATIMGLLAMVAAVSYRSSIIENRLEAAKIKTEQLATGYQRFLQEQPVHLDNNGGAALMGNLTDSSIQCQPYSHNPKTLITCGYVENGGWTDSYVQYFLCGDGKNTDECKASVVDKPLACMAGRSDLPKMPRKYRRACGYLYCVGPLGAGEQLGNPDSISCNTGVQPGTPEEPGV
ncbi:MAG: prepilin-type N-terminal cleavage/methylation domain-containing protein [Elusimicrobiaceae bacterium]|nr:prepilin-type N-terminal cleavage/methylation domain-containing protein [Elusimicrobiaceae bacterium]